MPAGPPMLTVVEADVVFGRITPPMPRPLAVGLSALARPVTPTGLPKPQPVAPGSPTPDVAVYGEFTLPKPPGRYGAIRHANDGGISTPSAAVTVTVSGCAVGDATSSADACPFRNVVFCPGICPVGTLHGVDGVTCGAFVGNVVMLMFPGMFTRHGRMLAFEGSDTVHVIVAPVAPESGVPLMTVTVAVQIEPVLPAAIVLGLHDTAIRGALLGPTVITVEPTACRPPIADEYTTLIGASPATPAPIASTAAPVQEKMIGKVGLAAPVKVPKSGDAPLPNGLVSPLRPQPTPSLARPLSKMTGPGVE